jgi:small-conductance mechanosensitive channel
MMLATILDRAGDGLGGFLPRLGGALLLLIVGWLVVALIRRALTRVLRAAGVDALGERTGANDVLARFGVGHSLTTVIAGAVRIGLLVVVIFAALSLLGLEFLSDSLNAGILFLPRLLVAMALVLAGFVLATMARHQVDRMAEQMDLPGPLGAVAEVAVITVFGMTALAQLGVPVDVLLLIAAIVLAAVALTFALAFGIGGQATAREVSARRYVEGAYEIGTDISVAGLRGRITQIDATATVLETTAGDLLRVPNSQLVASIVTVHAGP